MRFSSFVTVAAILGFSVASSIHRKHEEIHNKRHEDLFERHTSEASANSSCGCTTIWSTIYGEPTCTSHPQDLAVGRIVRTLRLGGLGTRYLDCQPDQMPCQCIGAIVSGIFCSPRLKEPESQQRALTDNM